MTDRNETLFNRAKAIIPGGVNSPVRAFGSVGGVPRFIKKAKFQRKGQTLGVGLLRCIMPAKFIGREQLPLVDLFLLFSPHAVAFQS